ncbi:MAG: SH3 domain-containing protein [Spirochaetaceae bacterium]|jgi:hypothetical protein|nr:SH3 domain-containing protein [Spirochaetaceae bacterium]
MKKKALWLLPVLIILCLVVVSCVKNKNSAAETLETDYPLESDIVSPDYGYIIRDASGLYDIVSTENGKSTAKWKAGLDLGERVKVLSEGITAVTEEAEYSFIEVEREDTQKQRGFVMDFRIAVGAKLAVIIEPSTYLYKAPKYSAVWTYTLTRGSVVAFWPDIYNGAFIKIKAFSLYDGKTPVYFPYTYQAAVPEVFILCEAVSLQDNDVQAAILLTLARNEKNEAQKNALLNSALKGFSSSVFVDDIRALLNLENDIVFTTTEFKNTGRAHSDDGGNINVRDKPGIYGSNVVFQLSPGTGLVTLERTNEEDVIHSVKNYWWKIQSTETGRTGWIFGGYLLLNSD